MSEKEQRRRMKRSVRQEKRIAVEMGGKRVAGSGNQPGHKGDVKDVEGSYQWLVESKFTDKYSYALKLSVWRKIESEAIREGKEPALQLEVAGRQLVVIDYKTWLMLRGDCAG